MMPSSSRDEKNLPTSNKLKHGLQALQLNALSAADKLNSQKLRPAIPAQKPNQPRLWLDCACQDVLCAGKGFFITVIHNGSGWFFCPQTGQILRTQNLKSKPQRRAALSRWTAAQRGVS
jgi:hypothetical protein